ncbi:MAG TPA: rod shape-determining protein MreD [Pirellulales bacterium]|jgi:cell shape-determining protein MreD|nr:rod shape-determining protein MreD [Pirellulales bacterium]
MSSFLFIPMLYLAAVLQTWFAIRWDALGVGPNLLVLVGFSWLTQAGSRRGLLVAALAGLVSDLNSPMPLGWAVALFAGFAYGVVWLRQRICLDSFPAQLGVVWSAAAGITLAQGLLSMWSAQAPATWSMLVQRSALVGLYTMCVAIPILVFVFWRRDPQKQFG